MVEMKDRHQANNVDHYLHYVKVFDATLSFKPSAYLSIRAGYNNSFTMDNGTLSFFECREDADVSDLKLAYPSKTLQFSNLPAHFTEDQFKEALLRNYDNGPIPSEIVITSESDNESKVVSGTIRFESKKDSATFIMIYNNLKIESQVLKICFI